MVDVENVCRPELCQSPNFRLIMRHDRVHIFGLGRVAVSEAKHALTEAPELEQVRSRIDRHPIIIAEPRMKEKGNRIG